MKDVAQREPMLVSLLKRQFTSETIIFCEKKSEAHRLQIVLGLLGLHCAELHGDLLRPVRPRRAVHRVTVVCPQVVRRPGRADGKRAAQRSRGQ